MDNDSSTIKQNLFDIPVNSEVLFSNHANIYKKRIEKRQTKLANKILFIKPFLKENETILLITTACSPASFFEQYLMGFSIYYIKRSLLVFTNKRIFHIPTKTNYSYRNSIAQILYADCQSIRCRGRTIVVRYKNGEKENFFYASSKEKKKIKSLIKNISFEGIITKNGQRTHLCPRCTEELENEKYVCPKCRLEFKDRDTGKRNSIIYPGGGYFYTGHPILGIGDAIAELILLIFVFKSLINTLQGIEGASAQLILLGLCLIVEKLISVYHANHFIKEYIPKEKEIEMLVA